jgi:ornithine carbamoyltransferase
LIAVAGRAGVAFELDRAAVSIGSTVLFKDGHPHDEAAPLAAEYLKGTDLTVSVDLGAGRASSTVWTCDLERGVRPYQRGLPNMTQAATRIRKDFLSILDFDSGDLERCLELAAQVKADRSLGRHAPTADALDGRHLALLFDKPSLRTRTTFEIAVRELGGHVVPVQADVALGRREPVADVARNLERWVDGVIIRTFSQHVIQEFAAAAKCLHVVNALTDEEHPCQAIADFLTLQERLGRLRGRTIAYVGDGNNVATSLVHAAAMLGVHVHVASPEPYQLRTPSCSRRRAARHGARVRLFNDAADAVSARDAVYTDTWTSMGRKTKRVRRAVFAPYQVNEELMALAGLARSSCTACRAPRRRSYG